MSKPNNKNFRNCGKKKNNKSNSSKFIKPIANRTRLGMFEGQFVTFRAKLGRESRTTTGLRKPTIELQYLYEWNDPYTLIADHIWIKKEAILNSEVVDSLKELKTEATKRICFTGRVYSYYRESAGGGFTTSRPHYSISDIEIIATSPDLLMEDVA